MRLALLIATLVAVLAAADPPSANRGREVFDKRCTGCHTLDNSKVGPALRGVYGRRSASDPRFPYSDALRAARLTWDDSALQRWLTDPDTVAPGNDMSFRLENSDERAAIVEYLKQLPGKTK
jgi:cytochrome c